MKYDIFAEQAALHNMEYCDTEIRRIDNQILDLEAEREEWEEKREKCASEAEKQRIAHEAEEYRAFEAEQ